MSSPERYTDLLAADAAFGIDSKDRERLEQLRELECSDYELAAAACHVGWIGEFEEMPATLRQKLQEKGASWSPADGVHTEPQVARDGSSMGPRALGANPTAPTPARAPGWMLAAAGLLAAFGAWSFLRAQGLEGELSQVQAEKIAREEKEKPASRLAALLERAPEDLLQRPFAAGNDATGADIQGEVFWTGEGQEGYMRLSGLAANDSSLEQYQLWIFDGEREDSPPVDGGLFDMPSGADSIVIPIEAGVNVFQPTLFAVTVEKPGGVVVSSKERIAIAASV